MRKGKNWWMDVPGYVKYLPVVRDTSIPVESFIAGLLKWLNKPKYAIYEPYGALMRDMFDAGKNGKKSRVSDWDKLLPRAEKIVRYADKHGSLFARTILNECIAHRYADCLLQTRDLVWEAKMRDAYMKAYKAALKGRYWKNVDTSLYWLAVAYYHAAEKNRFPEDKQRFLRLACKFYCKVANHKGVRYNKSSEFRKKISVARKMCERLSVV